jgi:hypothetical protein
MASATGRPCAVKTSSSRNLATISAGLCLFLLILLSSIGSKTIHQGGPLFRGQTSTVQQVAGAEVIIMRKFLAIVILVAIGIGILLAIGK